MKRKINHLNILLDGKEYKRENWKKAKGKKE
jgi:hypothetical protein